jgi:cyclophilin family peptidyl-prolyl cis-trans isomerase
LRAAAALAAGALGELELLERLARDPSPAVRRAALEARAEAAAEDPPGRATLVAAALADPDPTVRATALDLASAVAQLPVERLAEALRLSGADRELDARIAAIRALAARAEAAPAERRAAVAELEKSAGDREYLVRREAADALAALGQARPEVVPIDTGRTVADYREVLLRTSTRPRVALETERGRLTIRLECPEAPLTCLSFLQLAAQGYFDGLPFHRVVPDFVVQGGDPRGDGWGGPGYALRDEINRHRYERGAVGMALSGADTGGSQFFVTLAPQPHLDGGYTVFGHLVEGVDRLDRIAQGDRILSVRLLD